MKVIVEGQLMKAKKNDYEFDGKKGTSYKLDIYADDRLESVSVSADTFAEYKDLVGNDVTLECKIYSRDYKLKHIEEN
ncbi:hypothetical protein GKZ28_09110 [Clostridium chromiireducens]|uniref:Uncharacterized protein n=1 Tax=Clostridium chromiireducens TaxID=225345 RepID=A0A964RLG6_9CLOT|nr:hypothetical protein [Clostridium chromiireducens]MVX63852.1 hypothetical protein [Clostridium chromiireducens]